MAQRDRRHNSGSRTRTGSRARAKGRRERSALLDGKRGAYGPYNARAWTVERRTPSPKVSRRSPRSLPGPGSDACGRLQAQTRQHEIAHVTGWPRAGLKWRWSFRPSRRGGRQVGPARRIPPTSGRSAAAIRVRSSTRSTVRADGAIFEIKQRTRPRSTRASGAVTSHWNTLATEVVRVCVELGQHHRSSRGHNNAVLQGEVGGEPMAETSWTKRRLYISHCSESGPGSSCSRTPTKRFPTEAKCSGCMILAYRSKDRERGVAASHGSCQQDERRRIGGARSRPRAPTRAWRADEAAPAGCTGPWRDARGLRADDAASPSPMR